MILPISYTLLPSFLDISRHPFASGGSGDLYEATLKSSKVFVKRGRVYSKDGPGKAITVYYPILSPPRRC